MTDLLWDAGADAALDALKALPFLFGAYLLLELLEKRWAGRQPALLKKLGPLGGAVLGCVPQCGFSVAAANFYAAGLITPGTLLAVFLATSDEALIILFSQPQALPEVVRLLMVKLVSAIAFGILTDLAYQKISKSKSQAPNPHCLCEQEHCGCEGKGVLRPAAGHTLRIFGFLLVVNFVLNLAFGAIGPENIARLLLAGSALQPFLTALLGFIPNCAASVLLTELYLSGAVSFGAAVAGLCTGAGVGLALLFRLNKPARRNIPLVVILYLAAVLTGQLCGLFL